jgi:diguanylate cyclase (GGDEF)-like protein
VHARADRLKSAHAVADCIGVWSLPAQRHGRRPRLDASLAFALRLLVSFVAALFVVGVVGYAIMDGQLRSSQIERYAEAQRTDARTFEIVAATSASHQQAIARIDQVLDALARRDGTLETMLIDPSGVIRASGNEDIVGKRDMDQRIAAALIHGASYAGQEAARSRNAADFELVTPVDLPDGRYAFEMSYDHRVLDSQLSTLRRGLLFVGLLLLLGGGVVFYLFGGRALLRNHRAALQRATRDGLTDLPNQRAFQDEFSQALAAAQRNQDPLALIALDLDDFKFINDRHGHPHGDVILKRLATVLGNRRPGDRAYRVGGDEFAVLLPHTDADGVRVLSKRLLRLLNEAKLEVTIGASAWRPGHPTDRLRAEADAALYEAKRLGGHQIALFEDIRDQVTVTGRGKQAAVRRLLEEEGVTTVYQPIWNIAQRTLLGVEALSRPDAGYDLSGPAEAFDIAEQIGRVHELDAICVKSALAAATELPGNALLFLNLCPRTLDLDADGNDWLSAAVEHADIPAERVVIEITERFGGRAPGILKCLRRLRAQGFKIALDDVGTGNSGLAALRQIDVEFVKLDRTIVSAASTEPGSRAVLMAIAAYAHETGAFVIAEGIEDEETLEFLRSIDDRELHGDAVIQGGQGYGLGRPSPVIATIAQSLLHIAEAEAA